MEIGIQTIGDFGHQLAVASMAEASGVTALAFADHYLYGREHKDYSAPAYDSLIQSAALARETERLELVMLVSPITFRHPSVYAKTALTIDELSGGRFNLGLGTGWHEDEHGYHGIEYPEMSVRFEQLEESFGYVKTYFDDPEAGFEGEHYRFTGFDSQPRARQWGRRLLIGGSGEVKTPTLAGRYCDEFNLYHHTAEGIEQRLGVMRAAAEQAGRDPERILISTCMPLVGGETEEELRDHVRGLAGKRGVDPDEALDRWRETPGIHVGSWDEHREFIGSLAEMGIQRTYIQLAAGSLSHLERTLQELT